jgi:pimeloyl-ACP methyl ester carboxylesterase
MRTCLLWPPSTATPAPAPGARLPNVPVLVTPIELAQHEAARAPRATLVVIAGAGHSVQFRSANPAGFRTVNRFLLAR